MSPRSPKQIEEIRREKENLIKDCALKLFAENGFQSTTINAIAKSAKISKGLLYNYFESKDVLLQSIINDGFETMTKIFDPNRSDDLKPEEMEDFISKSIQMIQQNHEFWKLYWLVSFQPRAHDFLETKLKEVMSKASALMMNYFKNAGFENPETEALIFSATMDGIVLGYIMQPEYYPIERMKTEMIKRYCKRSKNLEIKKN